MKFPNAANLLSTSTAFLRANLGQWLKVACLPWLMLALLHTLNDLEIIGGMSDTVAVTLIEAMFAFLWHRTYLVSEESLTIMATVKGQSKTERKAFGEYMTRFMIWSFLPVGVLILMTIFGMVLGARLGAESPLVTSVVGLVLGATILVLVCRFLPFYPSIALNDDEVTLSMTFKATRGVGITLALTLFVIGLVQVVAGLGLEAVFLGAEAFSETVSMTDISWMIALNLLVPFITLFGLALGVTANSEIYRIIRPGLMQQPDQADAVSPAA